MKKMKTKVSLSTECERIWLPSLRTPNDVNGVPSKKTLWYRFGKEPLEVELDGTCWRFPFSLNK